MSSLSILFIFLKLKCILESSGALTNMVLLQSVELDKQSYCDLKVVNNTEHHVAFKVLSFRMYTHAFLLLYLFSGYFGFHLAEPQFNVPSFPFLD